MPIIRLSMIIIVSSLSLVNLGNAQTSSGLIKCGIKPIPEIGCEIGRCVNGEWEQVCSSTTRALQCGIKPIPDIGCKIGQCVNGQWEQICSSTTGALKCGIKPIPEVGCVVGQCVNGKWEQVCSKSRDFSDYKISSGSISKSYDSRYKEGVTLGEGIESLGESIGNALSTRAQKKQLESLLQAIFLIDKIVNTGEINPDDRTLLETFNVSVSNEQTNEEVVLMLIEKLNSNYALSISQIGLDKYKAYVLTPLEKLTASRQAAQQLELLLPTLQSIELNESELEVLIELGLTEPVKALEIANNILFSSISHQIDIN